MKNRILYLMALCICGCISMSGQTDNTEVIKPLKASKGVAKDENNECDSLPIPQWEEGYATITGKTLNYDPTKDDNPNAQIYPRSSFGKYLDKKHGTAPVDSFGNYKLVVKLYQTHQPCFIDIPGYYGLMYLSPGDSVSVTVDNAARWANRHLGKEGSVLFVGGADNDINNMLATNEGHKVIWNNFSNNKGFKKQYAGNAEFIEAVMAHRSAQYANVDTLPFSDKMKQLLRLNIDCDAVNDQFIATMFQIVKPDTAYYSFIHDLGVDSPMLRWASDYDSTLDYCGHLYLTDDSGPKLNQMEADILENLLTTVKLDADEEILVEGMLKYNIDRMPMDLLKESKKRFSERISWLCDSLQMDGPNMEAAVKLKALLTGDNIRDARKIFNGYLKFIVDVEKNYGAPMQSYYAEISNNDFIRQSSTFYAANGDAWNTLNNKYIDELELIRKRHDMVENINRFNEITGIGDNDIRQNMIIRTYSEILSNGSVVPDNVFENEIKDFSPVAVSFLTEQNSVLKRVLAEAVSNVSQMSSDDDGDKIILNLVEKHNGKMVFIDIWNTWCGACLAAMADHEQEKGDYTDKVAFVYLADETSPETLWNERIKAFTGDHYRLPLDQHQSLMQRFNFQSYPSYIIIGSNGDILHTTNHIHSLSELDIWLK